MDTMGGPYKTEFVDGVFRSYHNHSKEDAPKYGARLRDAVTTPVNWLTPKTSMDDTPSDRRRKTPNLHCVVNTCGLPAPANPSTDGSRQESWATPRSCSAMAATITPETANDPKRFPNLETQVGKAWATPRANKVHPEITEDNRDHLANRNKSNLEEEIAGHCGKATGKLNPRWVETLMGLPIGWTMPSCTRPVIIAPTSFAVSGMGLSQPPQNEHLEH